MSQHASMSPPLGSKEPHQPKPKNLLCNQNTELFFQNMNKSILLFLLIQQIFANDNFYQWVQNVQNPSFECPVQDLKPLEGANSIIQVVNCEEPGSTFRYDFKVSIKSTSIITIIIYTF